MIIIDALTNEVYEAITSVYGDKWAKLVLPSKCDGCVDVELAPEVKIEVVNNEPMVAFKYKRKYVRVPRFSFNQITIE